MAYTREVVFVETPIFYRRVRQLMDDDDYAELQLVWRQGPMLERLSRVPAG